jgi:uncharacterized protein YacL
MKGLRRRDEIRGPASVHRSFRTLIILLFVFLGGSFFGSFAVPVLNALSTGLTRLFYPQGLGANAAIDRSKNTEIARPVVPTRATSVKTPAQKKPGEPLGQQEVAEQSRTPIPLSAPVYSGTVLDILPFVLLGAILGGYVGTLFLNTLEKLARLWDKMELGDKVNAFIGAFAGIFAALQFLALFQNLNFTPPLKAGILLVLMVGFAALVIYALQSMSEVLPWSRMRGPVRRSGIRIMDTNVIIDGRIYDVAKTGFLDGQLYVPGFVIDELQYIADSHDQLRRQRGRRGLEVLKHMRADFPLETHIYDKLAPDLHDGVDSRLVRLAQALGGDLLTNDFNLKRVAELQDVRVMSLNDLSLSLRPNVLPLETLGSLKIIKEGNQLGQGVGYLEDGTMVVVENGQDHVGETMDVTVTQVIQTERGKMIFAEVEGPEVGETKTRRRRSG